MADQLRGRAVEGVGHPPDLHGVVRHQTVAALQQLDGRFALADAGFPQQQHALSVDIHQHAVAGDLRSQRPVQVVDDLAGQLHGVQLGTQQRAAVLPGNLQQLGEDLHVPGDDEGRYLAAQQIVEHPAAVLQLHGLEEGHLGLAEHLQALGLEVVVKAHQLQGRAIHIGNAHRALVIVAAPAHDLHIKILHQLAELGGGALHLICHMEAPCSSVYIYSIISYGGRFYNTKNAACRPGHLPCGTRLPAP